MQGQVWIVVQCALRGMRCAPLLGLRSVSPPWRWLTAVPTCRGADNTWCTSLRKVQGVGFNRWLFFMQPWSVNLHICGCAFHWPHCIFFPLKTGPVIKVNLDVTVELRKSEIFLIIHFGTGCFYWWCGDRGPLSKWGESEGDSSDISCQCSHFEASHVTCVLKPKSETSHIGDSVTYVTGLNSLFFLQSY